MNFYIVTDRRAQWESFCSVLENQGHTVLFGADMEQCRAQLQKEAPALVVLDLDLPAAEVREAVISVLMVNAMVHTAVVSDMPETEFHDTMEGLGILMPLPKDAGGSDAEKMLAALHQLGLQ